MPRATKLALLANLLASTCLTMAESPLVSLHAAATVSHEDAARAIPVVLEGTVTYFRGYEKTLFVQDGNDAIYVNATTDLPLVPGDRILVRGVAADSFRPVVISRDVTFLRHNGPPAAVPAAYQPMLRTEFDCRYVTLRGKVIAAYMALSSGRSVTGMKLRMDGGYVDLSIDNDDSSRLKGILDADVAVTGVLSGQFDGKSQLTGLLLHVTSFNQVTVLRAPARDAWSIPVTPIDQVVHGAEVVDRSQRVRIQGILTYYRPSQMAVIQDGGRSIPVATPEIERLHVGDRAEVVGIPFVDDDFLTIKMGSIRAIGRAEPVMPRHVCWDELSSGKYAFDLVSLEGTLVTRMREQAQDVYVIKNNGNLFSATLPHPFIYEWNVRPAPPPMPPIRAGSRVRVTGVAILDDGNPYNGPVAFGLLMRTAGDVAVLAEPPWLDVRHLMEIVTGLLVAVLLISFWGAMLRRKVRRQAAELAKRIEAEAMQERRRSSILEAINANQPLAEILHQITGLVSFMMHGARCWLQVSDGAPVGSIPEETQFVNLVRQEIRSRTGRLQGAILLALGPSSQDFQSATEALSTGAGLATLAFETRGLYSDLIHRSEFDVLTDVPNRFSLEKHLSRLVEESSLHGACFGLIYIDLDHFKQINDRYGHHIGDLCLQQVAERMKRQLRPADLLARLGGDEFAALVTNVRSRADVEEVAARLDRCYDEPFSLDAYTLLMGASLGIAFYPEDGLTGEGMLSVADAAMYANKRKRREIDALARSGAGV